MLDLFSRLSKSEITEFGNFIKSPYYNTDKDLIKIFENLKGINVDYSSEFDNEQEIFKGLNFDTLKKNRLAKQFRALIKQFLKLKEFEKDENSNMMYELRALREKKIKTHYKKKLNEFIKIFDNKYKRDENYYSNRIAVEDDYYNFTIEQKAYDYPETLDSKRDNIIYNFYFQLLHCYNDMIIHEDFAGKNFNLKFPYMNEILNDIKVNFKNIEKEHPNICIIYYVISIQEALRKREDTKELEKNYLKYLQDNVKKFDKTQLFHYYLYIVNYHIMMFKKGNYEYKRKVLEIYQYQERNGFLFLNDEIPPDVFKDIVSVATTTEHLDWAEYFLEKYKKLLDPDKHKDFINIAYARINFLKRDYKKSISHLILVSSRNFVNYINAKIIFCKIYYEEKNPEAIEFELENLRKLDERSKKLNENSKHTIENFRKYMKQLLKIEELEFKKDIKSKEIAGFNYNEISNANYFIAEKNWFLQKFKDKFN